MLSRSGLLSVLCLLIGTAGLVISFLVGNNVGLLIAVSSLAALATVRFSTRHAATLDLAILALLVTIAYSYFIRYLIVDNSPEVLYFLVPAVAWTAFESEPSKALALANTSVFLFGFCLTVVILRVFHSHRVKTSAKAAKRSYPRPPPSVLLFLGVISIVALDVLMLGRGIGQQGAFVEEPLPFKLTGLVVYAKSVLLPCLFAAFIYLAERSRRHRMARLAAITLFVSGIFDMLLFSSRGALLNQLLFVGLLWLVAGFKLRKGDYIALTALVVGALFLVPIITAVRLYESGLDVFSFSQISNGIAFVLLRVTGFDQLAIIVDLASPLSFADAVEVLASPRGIQGYYSSEVLHYSESIPQTFAPSGLGWLYLLGGTAGVLAGSIIVGGALILGWKAFEAILPRLAPVAQAYFLLQLIMIITEGGIGTSLIAMTLAFGALLLLHWGLSGHSRKGPNRSVRYTTSPVFR